MGHYDDCYDEEQRVYFEEKKKALTELAIELEQLMTNVRRSRYYNEHTPLYHRLQEAAFWLQKDIP